MDFELGAKRRGHRRPSRQAARPRRRRLRARVQVATSASAPTRSSSRPNHERDPSGHARQHARPARSRRRRCTDGAIAGGRYLLRHLYDDGRFGYEYTPATDVDEAYGLDYSLPRHAGADLLPRAALRRHPRRPRSATAPAARSTFSPSASPSPVSSPTRSCVANPDLRGADLGAAAMALLAVGRIRQARHRRSRRELDWARRLAAFLLFMQKPDGDFCHSVRSSSPTSATKRRKLLYFSAARPRSRSPSWPRSSARRSRLRALGRRARPRARLADRRAVRQPRRPILLRRGPLDLHGRRRRLGRAAARPPRKVRALLRWLRPRSCAEPSSPRDDAATRAQPDFIGSYGFSPFLPPHANARRQPLGDDDLHLRRCSAAAAAPTVTRVAPRWRRSASACSSCSITRSATTTPSSWPTPTPRAAASS